MINGHFRYSTWRLPKAYKNPSKRPLKGPLSQSFQHQVSFPSTGVAVAAVASPASPASLTVLDGASAAASAAGSAGAGSAAAAAGAAGAAGLSGRAAALG